MDPVSFVARVWRHVAKRGDFVCLSAKNISADEWRDRAFEYGGDIRLKIDGFLREYPADTWDLYFCPLSFQSQRRDKKRVRPSSWLYADVDDGDISVGPTPTVLWQSSPGRRQALWKLTEELPPGELETLNRGLSYAIDADRGGWDLTQVLRIPGTKNHKYTDDPEVQLEYWNGTSWSADDVRRAVQGVGDRDTPDTIEVDAQTLTRLLALHKTIIPARTRRLLKKSATVGYRSDILWQLENSLYEAGVPNEDILAIIKASAWNKFKGRKDEDDRLRIDLDRVIEHQQEKPDEVERKSQESQPKKEAPTEEDEEAHTPTPGFAVESLEYLMSGLHSSPGWVAKGFWLRRSNGIIAGQPKSFKSTLALDLMLSVATGKPFLGRYEVENEGPTLMVQNENAGFIMKDRIAKILHAKGMSGTVTRNGQRTDVTFPRRDIPAHFIGQQSFSFSDNEDRDDLEELVTRLRPEMIVFDPLYLMFNGDINSAADLAPTLNWMLHLKQTYNCAVILVHHWGKGDSAQRGGQRMLGSTTLHGWTESAWYISTGNAGMSDDMGEDVDLHETIADVNLTIEREFRGAGVHPPLDLTMSVGDLGDTKYTVDAEIHRKKQKGKSVDISGEAVPAILGMLQPNRAISLRKLASETGFSRDVVKKVIDQLCDQGKARFRGRAGVILEKTDADREYDSNE